MARTMAVIKGDTPEQAIAEYPGEEEEGRALARPSRRSTASKAPALPGPAGWTR